MPAIAMSLPVLPGKSDAMREFTKSFMTEHRDSHHAGAQAHGFKRIKIWHQHAPDERVILYFEADDLEQAFASHHGNEGEFDQFVKTMQQELTGHSSFAGPPAELLVDWHEEKGHSATHHD